MLKIFKTPNFFIRLILRKKSYKLRFFNTYFYYIKYKVFMGKCILFEINEYARSLNYIYE